MSTIITLKDLPFKIEKKEALRYMGAEDSSNEALMDLVEKSISEVYNISRPTACYMTIDVKNDGYILDLGFTKIKSKSLAKNLGGCDKAFLFAATMGTNLDRLINRKLITSPAEALILDSIGSAAIEGVCNSVCNTLKDIAMSELKPRFSPGYGDLDIAFQKTLALVLDTHRKIGLTLTDGMMMTPTKSVTAIVGIQNQEK